MLDVILEGLVEIQDTGFFWDLPYKGTIHSILYKTFVPFIKADTKEADLFCGKYQNRTKAQQICRYCHCKTEEADDHLHKPKPKTKTEIRQLVRDQNHDRLKEISQHYLLNAFWKVRFSVAVTAGIHGSCPSEMLHALLLGIFKYTREIFFHELGAQAAGGKDMNALAQLYCGHFCRQSDRTRPPTNFSKGIQAGKMMAKEYRGILLVMLAVLRSTHGAHIMERRKKTRDETWRDDWMLLVETLLEWEAFLNEPEMSLRILERLKKKHRFIMYLMRKIANRTDGMGLKLMKFHAILHTVEDIILFGVPTEFDTGANESHHKPSKYASTLTQRKADTLNHQTATRLTEFRLVDLAMLEIKEGLKLWEYYQPWEPMEEDNASESESIGMKISTGETKIEVYWDEDGVSGFKMKTRSKFQEQTRWNSDVVNFWYVCRT